MAIPMTAAQVLDREFLEIRAKILQLAASFDRLDRASGGVADDTRVRQLREAMDIVRGETQERAEQVQMLFSDPYDDNWQKAFAIPIRG